METIKKLLENKALMITIGENARRSVISDFSDKAMVERTIEVYNKVLKGVEL